MTDADPYREVPHSRDPVAAGALGADRPGSRPLARAGALEELRRPHARSTRQRWPRPGLQSRRVKLGALAAVGALVVGPAVVFSSGRSQPSRTTAQRAEPPLPLVGATAAPGASETTASVPDVPVTTAPAVASTMGHSSRCPVVAASLVADTDGDGCAEALHYDDGVLSAGTARWSVGQVGDQLATGDWSCTGLSQLALLHPPTGDVFIFDGWAPTDHDVVAPAVARVEGGFALRAGDIGEAGCQRLVVDRRDGAPVVVPIGRGE